MIRLIVTVSILFLVHSSICRADGVYYFSEPYGEPCRQDVYCYNLTGYKNFSSNSVYYFLKGNHVLEKNSFMTITSIENITFQGVGETKQGNHFTIMESPVIVNCSNSLSGILFIKTANIKVRNITFTGCGGHLDYNIALRLSRMMRYGNGTSTSERMQGYRIALAIIESKEVLLEHISIQHSLDYGLVTINSYNTNITHSSFAYNNIQNYGASCIKRTNCSGGNALLVYTKPIECNENFEIYNTRISLSNFSFGFDSNMFSRYTSSGLAIYIEQADAYGINHFINNVTLYGNSGVLGANFRYTIAENVIYHTLWLTSVNSVFANEIYNMGDLSDRIYGAGLYIYIGRQNRRNTVGSDDCYNGTTIIPNTHRTTLWIISSNSSHNDGAFGSGMYLYCDVTTENQYSMIENCLFNNNSGFSGAGILITQGNNLNYRYQVRNITISNSRSFYRSSFGAADIACAIMLRRLHNISFLNLHVTNNPFTGMFLLNSQTTFCGDDVVFSNNTALNGGGLQIHGDSSIILAAPVHITFNGNTAMRTGGAILVEPSPYITVPCFFQPYDAINIETSTKDKPIMSMYFTHNYANMGGSILYGANIDSCYLSMSSRFYNPAVDRRSRAEARVAFNETFVINNEISQSLISSFPEYVCFCIDNVPDVTTRSISINLYPGSETVFSIVAVGVRNGTTPAIITIEELKNGTEHLKGDLFSSSVNCTNVTYVAPKLENKKTQVNYFINQVNIENNLTVFVDVLSCPVGFELSENGKCDCNIDIMELSNNVTCYQENASFWHNGGIWVGYDNDTDCFITSSFCPFDYCTTNKVSFDIEMQDIQCNYQRSGIQCGECGDGLSLMLGSNKCGVCSNNYLPLLIVFALAGVALVLIILGLNLTVSFGTINGLIFYANIVKINEGYFFPAEPVLPIKLFISWLNLDFGIPTCFSQNLDSVTKCSLQLVFPFYLWLVIIIIALMVHFSSRLTKLMGRKVIPVMATLLLLSFTKLLQACVIIWQSSSYKCNGVNSNRWAFDPNISYWSPGHSVLIAITIMIFIFLIVPYTLILFLSPVIERYLAQFKIFRWWIKLKPFIDAYDGPYRDKYRYWTGLLLLIRVVLMPVFAIHPIIGIRIAVGVSVLLLAIMAFTHGLYRHKALDALEIWFLLNLIFVALQATNENYIGYISVSLVIATVVCILIFHVLYQFNQTEKIKLWLIEKWERTNEIETNLGRSLSAYTRDILASTQTPKTNTSVRILKANHLEDGSWVFNKRETLLKDY